MLSVELLLYYFAFCVYFSFGSLYRSSWRL